MAAKVLKSKIFLLFLFIAVTEVASWTIDLPDVRRFLFERNEKHKQDEKGYEDYVKNDQTYYNNIQGNSPHNSEDEKNKHEDKFGHHSYMEKKVNDIIQDGSIYLEGLRRALESYSRFLQDCGARDINTLNMTSNSSFWQQFPFTATNMSNFNATNISFNSTNFMNQTLRFNMRNRSISCREATEGKEEVRRVADLALWTTKRLQDLAYARKYQRVDEREENELVLKLAWFLARLAYLTGYEPDPKQFLRTRGTTTAPTTSPTPFTLVPSSVELNRAYAECLRQNSTIPATVRCPYVGGIPGAASGVPAPMGMLNGTTPMSPESTTSMDVVPMSQTDSLSPELLETSDNIKSIAKRSAQLDIHYPPDKKSRVAPHLIADIIKNGISKFKTVVKSVKSLKETTYKAFLEKEHEKEHAYSYGSIPYLTIHKRSVAESNPMSKHIDPLLNSVNQMLSKKTTTENSVKIDDVTEENTLTYLPTDSPVTNNKSLKKRSITQNLNSDQFNPMSNIMTPVKSIKKRSTDDPFTRLANYFIKYKVWAGSNPITNNNNIVNENFEVKNDIRNKRSLFNKKEIHIALPKPLLKPKETLKNAPKPEVKYKFLAQLHKIHDISRKKLEKAHKLHEITSKKLDKAQKIHEVSHKNLENIHKIRDITHKVRDISHKIQDISKKKETHNIHKRSLNYGELYLPRYSENPQQDVSYYIKNREGTDFNPSLFQAAQVRLGLQQVYQTGNIEVVRRYGANYNPAVPNPFLFGILKTIADS